MSEKKEESESYDWTKLKDCPGCGYALQPDWDECPVCGKKVK